MKHKIDEFDPKYIEAARTLLEFMGEDPGREGLQETPMRMLKAWRNHWASGYGQDPKSLMKVFEDGGENYDEMVLVKNIKVYSHCEHHIAPIIGVAHVAYIPNGKILGLSKINRLVDMFARRLQVQERLTTQIADTLMKELTPLGVAVVIEAEHFCVKTRGVEDANSTTVTSALAGVFKDNPETRAEFMSAIRD